MRVEERARHLAELLDAKGPMLQSEAARALGDLAGGSRTSREIAVSKAVRSFPRVFSYPGPYRPVSLVPGWRKELSANGKPAPPAKIPPPKVRARKSPGTSTAPHEPAVRHHARPAVRRQIERGDPQERPVPASAHRDIIRRRIEELATRQMADPHQAAVVASAWAWIDIAESLRELVAHVRGERDADP